MRVVDGSKNGVVLDLLEEELLVFFVGKELLVFAQRDCDVHAVDV
jgi:hypothetical protein